MIVLPSNSQKGLPKVSHWGHHLDIMFKLFTYFCNNSSLFCIVLKGFLKALVFDT